MSNGKERRGARARRTSAVSPVQGSRYLTSRWMTLLQKGQVGSRPCLRAPRRSRLRARPARRGAAAPSGGGSAQRAACSSPPRSWARERGGARARRTGQRQARAPLCRPAGKHKRQRAARSALESAPTQGTQARSGARPWHCASQRWMQASWNACPHGSALPGGASPGSPSPAPPPGRPTGAAPAPSSRRCARSSGVPISAQHTAHLRSMRSTCSRDASCACARRQPFQNPQNPRNPVSATPAQHMAQLHSTCSPATRPAHARQRRLSQDLRYPVWATFA
jgi:hypothetical protein